MKVAVTSTVLFEVREGSIDHFAREFRRVNEALIGRPIPTVTGDVVTLLAIERLDVVDRERPSYTCPFCFRVSHNPHDAAYRYCGACHRFIGSSTHRSTP